MSGIKGKPRSVDDPFAPGCEWNPKKQRGAYMDEQPHAKATMTVGSSRSNWFVCDECAKLPVFKRFRTRAYLS